MPPTQKFVMSILWTVLACTGISAGQSWSGILAPTRAINWSAAGATIVNRTTNCTTSACNTLYGGTVTTASLNAAIASAPANTVVRIPAGSFTGLSGQVVFNNVSNVTLRGAGPDQTFLVWSSHGACNGLGADVCIINGDNNYSGDPHNVATWSAGYSQGTTAITFSAVTTGSISNLHVGSLLILDQRDPSSDTGHIWSCSAQGTCSQQGSAAGRSGRSQMQEVTATSISSGPPYTIGIKPGLYAPNWDSGQSPGAWWSGSLPVTGDGIENLSMNHSSVGGGSGIQMHNASNCWVSNVRSLNSPSGVSAHVFFYQSAHNTVQNSYFYGASGSSEGYGVDSGFGSADNLIQNNIIQHIAAGLMEEDTAGTVFAYNYAVDDYFGTNPNPVDNNWQQEDSYHHAAGDNFSLYEGNEGIGVYGDDIHGSSFMLTFFRNRYNGLDTATLNGIKTLQTAAVGTQIFSRYWNLVGNVFGTSGYHNNYQCVASGITNNCTIYGNTSIYVLGYSGNGGQYLSGFNNDVLVASTMMRWGNYDTVNAAARFQTSEDGHAAPTYPALTNASQTLPASFYLSSKPSWWGTIQWPAVGPDVTGGNVSSVGGHVHLNPAANCYLNVMGGKTDGSSGQLTFNADNCYSSGGGIPPPSNLVVVVH